jgi:hypothetical protein
MLNKPNKGLFINPEWGKQVNNALGQLGTERIDGFSISPSQDRVFFAKIDMTIAGNIHSTWQQVYAYTGDIYTKTTKSVTDSDPTLGLYYKITDPEIWANSQTIYSFRNLVDTNRIQETSGVDSNYILVPVVLRDSQWEVEIAPFDKVEPVEPDNISINKNTTDKLQIYGWETGLPLAAKSIAQILMGL